MAAGALLALSAGMLGAVNPCGFALLPAYLSVLISSNPAEPGRAVARALRCTLALTVGYVAVFGAFGLALTPIAGAIQPHLPWVTVAFGLALAGLGGWLALGGALPAFPSVRAPELTGSAWSMVLFGMAYAIASLGCAVGPFLALVVSSLRAGSIGDGLLLYVSYAAGMGLVVGVTAVAVALLRVSLVARARRFLGLVPRLGGAILLLSGLYVAYYGWYELRLARDLRYAGHDPVVAFAGRMQQWLAGLVEAVGALPFALLLAVLVLGSCGLGLGFGFGRRARVLPPDEPAAAGPTSPLRAGLTLRRRAGTR
ncbi:cytochrome c biogenesis CcdA family protein [Paractinoplanes globisporus]|uniref:Cytochrome c biogenesis CcdA family protein n=1 Tax=Paractinoplanes globisporus TaxID=113565 RepID=A0ABW6W6B8_9ACTN|nr:cytochrome c biogenesis protein CcdA [Actinoplanes globisporus]